MRPTIKHLKPADYRVMPWKNGGGSTTEIASLPSSDGSPEGFVWRISMADLVKSGPFSAFPGVERVLVPLEGPEFELDHGVHGRHRLTPLVPYRFSGDWTTTATLTGPGRDYNVMIARRFGAAWCEVLPLASGQPLSRSRPAEVTVITTLSGTVKWVADDASTRQRLGVGESLVCTAAQCIQLDAEGAATVVWTSLAVRA